MKALVTYKGELLIGKKEKTENHLSKQWHILEGHLNHGEHLEKAAKEKVKDQTGLDVEIHQVVDVTSINYDGEGDKQTIQVLLHCEADERNSDSLSGLKELKWVEPDKIKEYVHNKESQRLKNRPEQDKFLEKMKKSPF